MQYFYYFIINWFYSVSYKLSVTLNIIILNRYFSNKSKLWFYFKTFKNGSSLQCTTRIFTWRVSASSVYSGTSNFFYTF